MAPWRDGGAQAARAIPAAGAHATDTVPGAGPKTWSWPGATAAAHSAAWPAATWPRPVTRAGPTTARAAAGATLPSAAARRWARLTAKPVR